MGVLCARTLKSIYIIADRLSSNIDWSGFSILFLSLFPSNRYPLVLSYVSLIRPITAAYIAADWCDTVPVYLETYLHYGCDFAQKKKKAENVTNLNLEKFLLRERERKSFSNVTLCRNSISLWF